MKKPKVGLISFHSFFEPGGVKKHVLGLYNEFKRRGIETKIIVPRRSFSENYGKDVILLGTSFPFPFNDSRADFCLNFNPLAIEKTVKRENFDILHFHNFGVPSALQVLEKSQSLNILTFHANMEGSELLKKLPFLLRPLKKVVQKNIDGLIGVSSLPLEIFKNFKGPKTIIPNGIDLQEFNPKNPKIKKFQDDKINLLFVGRIEKRKGLIYLLRACEILEKKYKNLRLIIVGEGNLKKECQDFAARHKLKEVYFEGKKTGKDLPSYFTTAHIFCSPATHGESFGIVLLEAMASGTPLVAFANRGYKEFLKGKEGGEFLVRPKCHRALANKLEILIKDEKLRKKMAKWGIQEAQNYSWPKIADQVLQFYQKVLEIKK